MKRRFVRYGLSFGFLLTLFGLVPRASAESCGVLFVSPEKTPFSARMRGEIEAMGFEVVPTDLLEVEGNGQVCAAARVIESPLPRRVELWLRDESAGRLALDRVLEVEPEGTDATSAVRASEQLRAFFQPLREAAAISARMPPRPPPPPLLSPPPLPRKPQRSAVPRTITAFPASTALRAEEGRFFLEVAGVVPVQTGSLGLNALLRAQQRFGSIYGLGVRLVLPVVPSTVHSAGNSADVSTSLFGVELSALLVTTRKATLGARAGLSVLWLSASGEARAPYTDRVARKLAALPSLGTELSLRLTQRVRLCLGAELGISVPKLELAFAGQRVAAWARPLGLFSVGVGVAWSDP